MSAMIEAGKPVPPAVAWITLGGCGLAAVLAGLSLQAHVLAANDLGGSLGLSADEASWILTAGVAAEGAAVLIAAPLTASLGVRRVIAGAAVATGGLACLAQFLPAALTVIRFAQAFACALLPVVMMVWAMRAFPPGRRGLPLMLFAFASSFPSAIAALAAGSATAHWGGAGLFIADLIWAPAVALLAMALLPREPLQLQRLAALDWWGYAVLAAGIMLILVALNQGERRFWMESHWMAPVVAAGTALLALAVARLLTASNPYLDLSLLRQPTFAIGMAEALCLRFGVLMAGFAVPQALARLQGFRVEQAGEAVVWLAVGQIIGFPLAYHWLERLDGRCSMAAGLAIFAAAALWASLINPFWQVEQFAGPMILAGVGQGLFLTSIMTFATWNVAPAGGATAAGLFNLTRVLGTAGATAALSYGLRIRENEHSSRIVEGLTTANEAALARLDDAARTLAAITPDAGAAQGLATAALARSATAQAFTLAFADVFLVIACILAGFALLVPLLPRIGAAPPNQGRPT